MTKNPFHVVRPRSSELGGYSPQQVLLRHQRATLRHAVGLLSNVAKALEELENFPLRSKGPVYGAPASLETRQGADALHQLSSFPHPDDRQHHFKQYSLRFLNNSDSIDAVFFYLNKKRVNDLPVIDPTKLAEKAKAATTQRPLSIRAFSPASFASLKELLCGVDNTAILGLWDKFNGQNYSVIARKYVTGLQDAYAITSPSDRQF